MPAAVPGGDRSTTPVSIRLYPPATSPFTGRTTILVEMLQPQDIRLNMFDIHGRHVRCLAEGRMETGRHKIGWDGADYSGRQVSPGVYFCRLETGGADLVRKVVLVR